MCISENRGGHHGRLVVPQNFESAPPPDRNVPPKKRMKLRHDTEMRERYPRQLAHHNYHDHRRDVQHAPLRKRDGDSPPGLDKARFPIKLHALLDRVHEEKLEDVVSWQPHGRCFRVHKQEIFLNKILPKYFDVHKFASFQRQLNLYGFQRITRGPDKGSYYHELMLRGKPFLAHRMERTRVKGTKVRPKTNPEEEPNFYAMPALDSSEDAFIPEREHEEVKKERKSPSPSPAVVDTRTPKQKLSASFPNESVSSTVIPNETTSSDSELSSTFDLSDLEEENDDVVMFEGRPFHYLDPFDTIRERQTSLSPLKPSVVPSRPHERKGTASRPSKASRDDSLFSISEMDAMMERLNRPGGIWSINVNDMDEDTFGNVLENLVIHGDKFVAQV